MKEQILSPQSQRSETRIKQPFEMEVECFSIDSQIFLKTPRQNSNKFKGKELQVLEDDPQQRYGDNVLQMKMEQLEAKTMKQTYNDMSHTANISNTFMQQQGIKTNNYGLFQSSEDTFLENGQHTLRYNDPGMLEIIGSKQDNSNQRIIMKQAIDFTGSRIEQVKKEEQKYQYEKKMTKEVIDRIEKKESISNNQTNAQQQQQQNNSGGANLKLIAQTKKRIMYFFKNFTSSGRRQYLSNLQIRWTIDDQSDQVDLGINTCFLIKLLREVQQRILRSDFKVQNFVGLLNPHSQICIFFLFLFSSFNFMFFILLSIFIIYLGQSEYDLYLSWIAITFFVLESLIQLNTKFYKGSHLISDRYMIAINYFKTRALADFVAIILLALLPDKNPYRVICQCLTFIKMNNVMGDIGIIQKILCMTFRNYYMIQLINLILKILVVGHVIACSWYLIGQIELHLLGYETTWYDEGLASDYTWWKLYLESMYWSLTLLTTGSNVAYTILQMFFTTFIMLFTTILFGYLMNVTGTIISQFDQQEQNKQLDLNIINEYMRTNHISKELQARVNLDIENYYQSDLDRQQSDKSDILKKISPILQAQLKFEYANQILEKVQVFQEKFSSEFIEEMSDYLIEEYYLPNQIIFSEQQFNDISLYFIIDGQVELSQSFLGDDKTSKVIQRMGPGSLLGQVNFFTGQAQDKTARSNEFTKIVRIDRYKFIEGVSKREKDYQTFCEIRDQLLVYENYEIVGEKCVFCQNSTHLEQECHLIHIQKDEIYQRIKFFENKMQVDRIHEFKRSKQKHDKFSSLANKKKLQIELRKYRELFKPNLSKDSEFSSCSEFSVMPEESTLLEKNQTMKKSNTIKSGNTMTKNFNNSSKIEIKKQSTRKDNMQLQQQHWQQNQFSQLASEIDDDEDGNQIMLKNLQNISEFHTSNQKKKSEYQEDQLNIQLQLYLQSKDYTELSNIPPNNFNCQPTSSFPILSEDIYFCENQQQQQQQSSFVQEDAKKITKKNVNQLLQEEENQQEVREEQDHKSHFEEKKANHNQKQNSQLYIQTPQHSKFSEESEKQNYHLSNNYSSDNNFDDLENVKHQKKKTGTVVSKGNQNLKIYQKEKSNSKFSQQNFYTESRTYTQQQQLQLPEQKQEQTHEELQQQQQLFEEQQSLNLASSFNDWDFDKLQDYHWYFPKGNSKVIIIKYFKRQKKFLKTNAIKKKSPK